MRTTEELLRENEFNFDFFYEINDNEALISRSGALIEYKNYMHLVQTNKDHTSFAIVDSFLIPDEYSEIEVLDKDGYIPDNLYINLFSKDAQGKRVGIYAFLYNTVLREKYFGGQFLRFFASPSDLAEEEADEASLEDNLVVPDYVAWLRSDAVIGKLRISTNREFDYLYYARDYKDRDAAREYVKSHPFVQSIENSYYVSMSKITGEVIEVLPKFEDIRTYLSLRDRTTRRISYLLGHEVNPGLMNQQKALEELLKIINDKTCTPLTMLSQYVLALKGTK